MAQLKDTTVNGILNATTIKENGTLLSKLYNPLTAYTYSGANDGVSCASGAWTTVMNVTLDAGTYLLIGHANLTANANGYRRMCCETSASSTGSRDDNIVAAASGVGTTCQTIRGVTPKGKTTYYWRVYQNSGSTLTCYTDYMIFKFQ